MVRGRVTKKKLLNKSITKKFFPRICVVFARPKKKISFLVRFEYESKNIFCCLFASSLNGAQREGIFQDLLLFVKFISVYALSENDKKVKVQHDFVRGEKKETWEGAKNSSFDVSFKERSQFVFVCAWFHSLFSGDDRQTHISFAIKSSLHSHEAGEEGGRGK